MLKKINISKTNGWDLIRIPVEKRNYELCIQALKANKPVFGVNYYLLSFVPKQHLTYELCYTSVCNVGRSLEIVPQNLRDRLMCLAAVKSDGGALGDVPINLVDYDMCSRAINQSGEGILFVPIQFMTKELVISAMKTAAHLFYTLPNKYLNDYDVCYVACKYLRDNLKYVPNEIVSSLFKQ